MDKKGQFSVGFFVGLIIIMVGILAVTFMGIGFMFRNAALVWVGSVVLGIISVTAAILEKVVFP